MGNYILGGRLGDLVHELYVVANTPGKHDLFITDDRALHSDGFLHSLPQTLNELAPVLIQQPYVNSLGFYTGPVTEATEGEWINLNMWRRKAYSDNWTVLLSKMFNVPVNGKPWIKVKASVPYNKIIHCSTPAPRKGNWDGVNLHGGVFMGSIEEYRNFNRLELPHIVPHTLEQMFSLIAGCGEFIGNQSLPLAIAHALDVPHIGVLNPVDQAAYVGEEKIFSNFKYVV